MRPPKAPELSLCLINEDYPRDSLSREQEKALMDNPPYWAFCWASGQVLGRFVLDNADWVTGKTLVDRFATGLVSDSRLKGQPLPGMDIIGDYDSHTVPNLDESREFDSVTLYLSRQNR